MIENNTITKEEMLNFISGLSVLELSELVKEIEEIFDVKATPSPEAFEFNKKLFGVQKEE